MNKQSAFINAESDEKIVKDNEWVLMCKTLFLFFRILQLGLVIETIQAQHECALLKSARSVTKYMITGSSSAYNECASRNVGFGVSNKGSTLCKTLVWFQVAIHGSTSPLLTLTTHSLQCFLKLLSDLITMKKGSGYLQIWWMWLLIKQLDETNQTTSCSQHK